MISLIPQVMTDWLAHIGGPSSALSGLDMSMPGDGVEALVGSSYVRQLSSHT